MPELIVWAVVTAVVGFAAVTFASGSELGLDAPLLIAASLIFGPIPAGLIAFVGYVDVREFRGEIPVERALFNRSQIAISVISAGAAFQASGATLDATPALALGALLAVAVDMAVNWAMVVNVRVLHERVSLREAVSGSHTGQLSQFLTAYLAFSLLSVVITQAYLAAGTWALAMFGLVAVLGRRAFKDGQSLSAARRAIRDKDAELLRASRRLADERRDERLALAAGLHDEVLPPLFKVHLMAQVVRQDLSSGRLLDLESDVPELIHATELAGESMRRLIGELRASPIGAHGLTATLELLCRQLSNEGSVEICTDLREFDAPPMIQLLTYQVGREALRNALKHSHATRIDVSLRSVEDSVRLVVADNGTGFVPALVDYDEHFGLQLIRDRVELFGGTIVIDTSPGSGTRVAVRIPLASARN